jgi:hypothetical protein
VNGPVPNLIIDEAAEIPDGELWMFSEPKSSRVFVDGKEIEATITDWKLEAPAPGEQRRARAVRLPARVLLPLPRRRRGEVPRGDQGHHVAPESTRRLRLVSANDAKRILALQRAGLNREASRRDLRPRARRAARDHHGPGEQPPARLGGGGGAKLRRSSRTTTAATATPTASSTRSAPKRAVARSLTLRLRRQRAGATESGIAALGSAPHART